MLITIGRKTLQETAAHYLNVDACRIGTGTGEVVTAWVPDHRGGNYQQGSERYSERPKLQITRISQGRYPSNLIIHHLAGCAPEGTALLRSRQDIRPETPVDRTDTTQWRIRPNPQTRRGYADSNGVEQYTIWCCEDACAGRVLGSNLRLYLGVSPTDNG